MLLVPVLPAASLLEGKPAGFLQQLCLPPPHINLFSGFDTRFCRLKMIKKLQKANNLCASEPLKHSIEASINKAVTTPANKQQCKAWKSTRP